jgi:FxsC-like protein
VQDFAAAVPPPSFFFSYAGIDRELDPKKDIRRFFNDLNRWVVQFGCDPGFFDKQGIDAGDDWRQELRVALQQASVLVPMYSPRYFKSGYCLWEWATVYEPYAMAAAGGRSPVSPIVPVTWLDPRSIPAPYERFQFPLSDFPPNVAELSGLMSVKKHREHYDVFVRAFARQIADRIVAVGPVNRAVGPVPRLDAPPAPPSDTAGGPEREAGAQYVRFLFVTGLRDQIVPPRRFRECYGRDPERKDWRPCFPSQDRQVSDIIEEVAREEGRVVRYLAPGDDLMDRIHAAERQNNIVVVVVDPWSLNIAEWRQFVQDFDTTLVRNCGVLVLWNKEDPETAHGRMTFSSSIQESFDRRIQLTNTFFRESVVSIEELQQTLVDAFHKIRSNLINEGRGAAIKEGMSEGQPLVSI